MRHENSVFHGVLKHVPWDVFDRLVDKHGTDWRVRRLPTKSQFLAMLFGQLAGASSLREIEAGLLSHAARLYHVGARPVARTTLADANAKRSADLFAELFAHMAASAGRRVRARMGEAVRILDATRLEVSALSRGWVEAMQGTHAVKLHIAYDPRCDTPLDATLTDQRVNDITPAKALPIEAGATYIFDLGYYDYAWWAALDAEGCRFITRLKRNTPVRTIAEHTPEGSAVLAERTGLLPRRMARSRRNPFAKPVREITVRLDTGKTIRLVTNDLKAPAQEIADLYKERWKIELFFKWIKQNLKIKHFLGTSENAVRIQIFTALIAYILLRKAQTAQSAVKQPLAFARLIRINLMHRRSIQNLKSPKPPPQIDTRQMPLNLTPI